MGRYGCDPPRILLETMCDEFNRSHGPQDVMLLSGDLSAHYTSMNIGDIAK